MLADAPALAVIDLGPDADVARAQAVLDQVAGDLPSKRRRGIRPQTRDVLIIRGDVEGMRRLRERFEAQTHGGWDRRVEVEERFQRTLPSQATAHCFSKEFPSVKSRIAVLLQGRRSGTGEELRLSGVVPLKGRTHLDPDQRDQVVSDFRDTFVKPLARGLGVRVVDRAVQLCGATGVSGDAPLSRFLAEVRPFRIYDGPTETHKWSIGRRLARARA